MSLENSGLRRVERSRQEDHAAHAAHAAASGAEEPSRDPVMDELLGGGIENQSFGEYLGSLGNPENKNLATRLKTGKHAPGDMTKLIGLRKGYVERRKQGEQLSALMDTYMEEMIRESTKLKDVAGAVGEENFLRLVKQGVREMAITDPREAARVAAMYKRITEFNRTVDEPATKKIREFAGKNNVVEDDIWKALDKHFTVPGAIAGSPPRVATYEERVQAVQEVLRKNMTGRQKFGDSFRSFFSFGSRGKASEIALTDVPDLMKQRDRILKHGGDFMRALVEVRRPEIHDALLRAMKGEEPQFKEGFDTKMTFQQVKENQGMREELDKPAAVKRAKEFAAKYEKELKKGGKRADGLREVFHKTEEVRKAKYENFEKKQSGFWASVFRGIAAVLFDSRTDPDVDTALKP